MQAAASLAAYEKAGPSFLADQPLTAPEPRARSDWSDLYRHLEAQLAMLRTWRYSWWVHWARLARYILPYRYHWVITANTLNRGSPVNDTIIDETATLAMRICASGMLSGLMSPARPWFKLGTALPNFEPDAAARRWLDDTTERIYTVLGGSNFYTQAAQLFQDVSTFGTSPLIIYEDHADVIRCYIPCAGEYFLAVGGRLSVDTLYREFTFTVLQLADWFGVDACPAEVQSAWQEGGAQLGREYVVAHAIEPNYPIAGIGAGRRGVDPVKGDFAYREVYWLRGQRTEAELSRRGFREKPFVVARWSVTSNDAYGRGPGMDVLGGGAQLQQQQRRKGEFIDKGVRPPMGADPFLENKPSSILPGEITYVSTEGGKKGFWPLIEPHPQWLAPLSEDIKEVQNRINRGFFTDVFLMITQMEGVQPRNELEIAERKGEKIQMLGPVIELFETEVASPAIQRVVSIMSRRGLLSPPPPSLRGIPIAIEYVSMMKLAQRAAETASMERGVTVLGQVGAEAQAAGLPNPARIVNFDEWGREYLNRLGFPARAIYSEDEVSAADQQRSQAAQARNLANAVPAAAKAAESLGSIDVGGGQNAIQAMLGTQPAQQAQAA